MPNTDKTKTCRPLNSQAADSRVGNTARDATGPVRSRLPAFSIHPGVFLAVFLVAIFQVCSTDIFWHLEIGRRLWESGRIMNRNVFSWTSPAHPWTPTYWLFEAIAYPVYAASGAAGLVLLRAVVLALAWAIPAAHYQHRGMHRGFLFLFVLAAVDISVFRFLLRPHIFTYLGLGLLIPLLDIAAPAGPESDPSGAARRRNSRRRLWTAGIPALFLVWTNLHSGVIFGFVYLGIFGIDVAVSAFPGAGKQRFSQRLNRVFVDPRVRWAAGVGLASLLACLINPTGWGFFKYLYDHLTMDRVIPIEELAPFHPMQHPRIAFALVWLLLLPPAVSAAMRTLSVSTVLRTGFALALLTKGVRFVPIAAVFSLPGAFSAALSVQKYLALRSGNREVRFLRFPRRAVPWLFYLVLPVCYAAHVHLQVYRLPRSIFHSGFGVSSEAFPLAAAEKLPPRLDAGLYNSFGAGGYIIWRFHGRVRVFQDGRIHAYPASLFREIVPLSSTLEGSRALLKRYDIRWVLLRKEEDPVIESAVRDSPDWEILEDDPMFLTAARKSIRFTAKSRR